MLDALVDVADKASRESTRHQRRFEAAGRGMTLGESPTTPQSPLCKPVLIPQTRRDDYTDADPDPDLGWMDDLSFHVWRRVPDLVPIARVLFERELRVFVSIDFDGHKRDIAAFSAKCFRDINKVMGLIAQSLKTYACCKLAVTQTLSYIGPDGVAVYLSLGNLVQYIANSPTGNLHCVFTVTTIPPVETSFHAAKTHVSL